jgi:hypothetical protein
MHENSTWKSFLLIGATLLGIILVGLGVVLPWLSNPTEAVTEQQAKEYYAASRAVEEAAANRARRNRQGKAPTSADQARELQAARERYSAARQSVEEAKESKKNLTWWMKIGGFLFVFVGVGGLLLQKSHG